MHPKPKIVVALVVALVLAVSTFAPSVALAGSPLLSGYGGPGAGEQAILGSTLLGGSGGGSGSGGSGGGSGGDGRSGGNSLEGAGATSSTGVTGGSISRSGAAAAGTSESRSDRVAAHRGHRRLGGSAAGQSGVADAPHAGVSAYVYPSTLRAASYDSPVLGISVDDLLALIGTIATLALLGVLTIRLGRLQA